MAYEPKHWHYDDDLTEHDLNRIEEGIKGVSDEVTSSSTTQLPITHGMNLVTLEKRAGLPSLGIKGKTAVNLIPPFTSTRWNINSIFNERTTDRIEGTPETKEQSAICKVNLKKNTQYYIACKGENVRIRLRNPEGAYIVEVEGFELAFSSDQYEELDVIFSPITAENWADFVLEHVTLNEGTEPISYVHGFQPIRNPMIESTNKNLLPPFIKWITAGGTSKVESEYVLVVEAKNNYEGRYLEIDVFNHTDYSLSVSHNGRIGVFKTDGATGIVDYTADQQLNFNSSDNNKVRVYFTNGDLGEGAFTFSNPQLEIGSQATEFEPQKKSRTYYPDLTLASSEDGSVYDELLPSGEVIRRIEQKDLDGSLDFWVEPSIATNRKTIEIRNALDTLRFEEAMDFLIVSKYDGKILTNVLPENETVGDQAFMYDGYLYISIDNQDSGWGANYQPTEDEVKAYFNGWRMYASNDVVTPYNRTDGLNKRWAKIYCGVGTSHSSGLVVSGSEVSTVPTTVNDMGYTPYKLQYQLAEPRIEKVDPVGRIQLYKGNNQIEVVEGFISREKMNLHYLQPSAYQWNNTLRSPETWAKNKVLKIVNIYRNSDVDTSNWATWGDNSFGMERATIQIDKFDPTATYYVDYIALPSEFTASIEHASLHVPTSLVSQVEVTEKIISDMSEERSELFTSVNSGKKKLEATIIDKGGEVSKKREVPTFDELDNGINSIKSKTEGFKHITLYQNTVIGANSNTARDMLRYAVRDFWTLEKGNVYATTLISGFRVIRKYDRFYNLLSTTNLHAYSDAQGAVFYKDDRVISYNDVDNQFNIFDFNGNLLKTINPNIFRPSWATSSGIFDFVEIDGELVALISHFDTTKKEIGVGVITEKGDTLIQYIVSTSSSDVARVLENLVLECGSFVAENYAVLGFVYKDHPTATYPNQAYYFRVYKLLNNEHWSAGVQASSATLTSVMPQYFSASKNNPFRRFDYGKD